MLQSAMSTFQMFRLPIPIYEHSAKADGGLEAGLFLSF